MNQSSPHEHAEEIRRLFDEVADLDGAAREERLAREPDPVARREVEALLEADAGAKNLRQHLEQLISATAPEAVDLLAGREVSHYRIEEKLGGGGMGVVYRARDTRLDRTVALKFLPPELSRDVEAKARFIHEAKAASALDHRHIGTVFDIDETEEGRLFIAMAFYAGETLKAKIKRGQLPVEEALAYIAQIAEALERTHGRGIVHRDVKPANVIVTEEGTVKLLDFGLAKMADVQLTQKGTAMGTAAYMSPEHARGELVDHRTDLWSLGVVLFEMLTGQRPFHGEHPQGAIHSILNEEPEPVRMLRPEVSLGLENVVRTLLRKDPDERYQDVGRLLTDLNELGRLSETAISQGTNKEPVPSIAVLPFEDMSPKKDQEYFCDGLAEELISVLAQIGDLRVVARTSAFTFKGQREDIRKIGRRLNVETVLEGSVRTAGTRVRITAQLVNVMDGYHLWSGRYDRKLADIFAVQDEIARAIVEALQGQLNVRVGVALVKEHTGNPDAHILYLRGRYVWNKATKEGLEQAVTYFKQAIELDPTYARAYAGLTDAYIMLAYNGFMEPAEAWSGAKSAADKASELDEMLAEAHVARASILEWERNWQEAERAYQRATELKPSDAHVHFLYGAFLEVLGRMEESLEEFRRALELDPLSPFISATLGWGLYLAGDYDAAIAQLQKTLQMEPALPEALQDLGHVYAIKDMHEDAVATMELAVEQEPKNPNHLTGLAYVLAKAGRREQSLQILNRFQNPLVNKPRPQEMAEVYTALGQHDKAFQWLERWVEERPYLNGLQTHPALAPLRSEARFQTLLENAGLKQP